ncbi:MAG: acyltransferase [Proteobacteria bacterium]|nr:acyltransferase [Pseudomonadota bacterium]
MSRIVSRLLRPDRYPDYLQRAWWQFGLSRLFGRQGVETRGAVRCYGLPIIDRCAGSEISIGARVALCSVSRYTALGVSRPVILRTLRAGAAIVIGDDVGLSGTVICAATSVAIGDRCMFGADVTLFDTDFHAVDRVDRRYLPESCASTRAIVIEDDVFIGAGATILKGVRIGRGSVVGAHAVVSSDVEPSTVVAGNPAVVVRRLRGGDQPADEPHAAATESADPAPSEI